MHRVHSFGQRKYLLPQHGRAVDAFSPIREEAPGTQQDKSHVKKHRLRSDICNRISTRFCHQRTLSTTCAIICVRLLPHTRQCQRKGLMNPLELAKGGHLRRKEGRCLHATLGMQCMGTERVGGCGCGCGCLEPPSPALDGLLRSTPLQFAALGTIVAVIAAAILSLCS